MAFTSISSTSVVKTGSRRAGLKRHHCHLPSANVTIAIRLPLMSPLCHMLFSGYRESKGKTLLFQIL